MPDTLTIPVEERRRNRRRKVKSGTTIACRKGAMGLGPNIAVRLLDISEDGAQLTVKTELKRGDEIELIITPPGISKSFTRMADVVRCDKLDDGTFRLATRFRSMLGYSEMCHLF